MNRGELYRVAKPSGDPKRQRVYVIVSRQRLLESRYSSAICAPIYTEGLGLATQVKVGSEDGLKHDSWIPVSYTHLDVYKRQRLASRVDTFCRAVQARHLRISPLPRASWSRRVSLRWPAQARCGWCRGRPGRWAIRRRE